MTSAAFDTLKLARALREADFTQAQAEGAAEAIAAAIQSDLATKAEIQMIKTELTASIAAVKAELSGSIAEVKAELTRSIADVKAELTRSIAEVKADILKWMFGAIGFQTIVILGAVFALAHATR